MRICRQPLTINMGVVEPRLKNGAVLGWKGCDFVAAIVGRDIDPEVATAHATNMLQESHPSTTSLEMA
jgi:hypothetical protein